MRPADAVLVLGLMLPACGGDGQIGADRNPNAPSNSNTPVPAAPTNSPLFDHPPGIHVGLEGLRGTPAEWKALVGTTTRQRTHDNSNACQLGQWRLWRKSVSAAPTAPTPPHPAPTSAGAAPTCPVGPAQRHSAATGGVTRRPSAWGRPD